MLFTPLNFFKIWSLVQITKSVKNLAESDKSNSDSTIEKDLLKIIMILNDIKIDIQNIDHSTLNLINARLEKINQTLDKNSQTSSLPEKQTVTRQTNVSKTIISQPKSSSQESSTHKSGSFETTEGSLYDHKSSKNTHSQSSTQISSNRNISSSSQNSKDMDKIVADYNKNAKLLIQNITKVDSTPETIEGKRTGKNIPMMFTEINNGIYWLVKKPLSQDGNYFLVPKAGLVINEANYQTLGAIFECDNYENISSNNFQLISPAIVKKLSQDSWQLIKPGKLIF